MFSQYKRGLPLKLEMHRCMYRGLATIKGDLNRTSKVTKVPKSVHVPMMQLIASNVNGM